MALNIILDILLVAILAGGIAFGIKRGFINILARPLRSLLALALAYALASPVGSGLIVPLLSEPLINQISGFLYDNCAHITPDNTEELPTLIKLAANLAGVDVTALGDSTDDILASVVESLAMPIVNIIATLVAFVLLFIIFKLLFSLLLSVANSVFGKGVFGVFNKVLGCITSGLLAIFVAWAFVSVFEYVIHFPAIVDVPALSKFTGGFIYRMFKQYNPVELLLSF